VCPPGRFGAARDGEIGGWKLAAPLGNLRFIAHQVSRARVWVGTMTRYGQFLWQPVEKLFVVDGVAVVSTEG
jgi:hypothetical protein